jgi:hypothetical protein
MARYQTDLWQVGILRAPISDCLSAEVWPPADIIWLPSQPSYCFLADPFGVWRDEALHVFAEAYDYREKKGRLVRHTYDAELNWLGSTNVMVQPFHLSYPFLIEEGGELYLLPEAHRSGKLTLYKVVDGLSRWEKVADLLEAPAIDASVVKHQGCWWMFYALPGPGGYELDALHVAWAETLTGPWHLHSTNPVRRDRVSARPGGTPIVLEDKIWLPTQDGTHTYGGAVQWLRIDKLTREEFAATPMGALSPGTWSAPFTDGLHTLSACGPVTLFDVKRIDRSARRGLINLQRRWRRLLG